VISNLVANKLDQSGILSLRLQRPTLNVQRSTFNLVPPSIERWTFGVERWAFARRLRDRVCAIV
jgi:hypothetical protein